MVKNFREVFLNFIFQNKIVNYGIGGYYAPHHDFLYEPALNDYYAHMGGNRMSTWMTYVNKIKFLKISKMTLNNCYYVKFE